ncbi:MAG: helix-turn-helix transcriptional regulator [Lachnospiraceae bacterium]|nr:helix-turn-helix transcriptional regulator [Lachnospiraceae bacterium]
MKDIEFGSIRLKLSELMEKQNISINKLAFRSVMQRTQLKAYKNNNIQRVDLAVLARLCYALDCDISDLIEYIPPKE